jgi:phosphoribosylanthranilate isomerase
MIIKFCGIKRKEDIYYCNKTKPSHVGFVFFGQSKRYVIPSEVCVLTETLDPDIKKVGVFCNDTYDSVIKTAEYCQLDVIQLHGNEDEAYIQRLKGLEIPIWKAFKVTPLTMQKHFSVERFEQEDDVIITKASIEKSKANLILLDGAVAGSGEVPNWELIKEADLKRPFILAGGLNPENIKTAVNYLQPVGIDLSTGIETDGVKDFDKMQRVMLAVSQHYN